MKGNNNKKSFKDGMAARKKTNYLNNKDLLADTVASLEKGEMSPQLAHKLMMLVKRYARKANFANYTYNEDMQGYALMMLCRTWTSFKPEKSTNAFAFFTQCVKNSFIQYLNTERRQRDIRDSMLVDKGMSPSYTYLEAHAEKVHAERKFAEDEEDYDTLQQEHKNLKEQTAADEKDELLTF